MTKLPVGTKVLVEAVVDHYDPNSNTPYHVTALRDSCGWCAGEQMLVPAVAVLPELGSDVPVVGRSEEHFYERQ